MINAQKFIPFVSVIIPCRNEEKFIGQCLDSVINNNYSKNKLEILVVDGMSDDGTRRILEKYTKEYPFIKFLDNYKKHIPCALNIGVRESRGEIIIRLDAHLFYPDDYLQKCVFYLDKYKADNIGAVWKILPRNNTLRGRAIALALGHHFGSGNSYFRTGSKKVREVSTFFGGCYRKDIFQKIGFYNENLKRSQDIELNLRLKKAGGKILIIPDIVCYYYVRSSLKDFFIHNIQDGIWAIYPLKFVKLYFNLRHYIPFIFVSGLLISGLLGIFISPFFWLFMFTLFLYLLLNIIFGIEVALKQKDIRFLFLMPVAFSVRHIGYGLGSIWGLVKIII